MVVDDLDVGRSVGGPSEADAVLIVDPDAVLPFPVAGQGFESVPWRHSEVVNHIGRIEHQELLQRSVAEVGAVLFDPTPAEQLLRVLVSERLDHRSIVARNVTGCTQRYSQAPPDFASPSFAGVSPGRDVSEI